MCEAFREVGLLLRIQAWRFCGINALRYGHDRKLRRQALGALGIGLLIAAMAVGYTLAFSVMLVEIGAAPVIPYVLSLAALGISFCAVMAKGPQVVFEGEEQLRALPVRTASIVISRLLGVLMPELTVALLMGIPAAVVYARAGAGSGLALVIGFCAIPAIPTALALLLGTAVARLTVRFRHRAALSAVLSVVLLMGVMVGSFSLSFSMGSGRMTERMLFLLLGQLTQVFAGLYPPADWVAQAAQGSGVAIAWLWLSAVLALALTTAVATFGFSRISDGLASGGKSRKLRGKAIRAASPLYSLYKKEWLRYTSSAIYMMNTAFGWVLLLLMTGAVCVMRVEPVLALLGFAPDLDVMSLLPLAPALMAGMSSTTDCSISMEGKQMEIMRALPVSTGTWLAAKMLLHLTLAVPALLVCAAALTVKLSLTPVQAALQAAYPLSTALFCGVCGLALNLRFPRLSWEQDVQAVKGGVSVLLTIVIGMLVPVLTGALCFWLKAYAPVMAAGCAVQLLAALFIGGRLKKARMP